MIIGGDSYPGWGFLSMNLVIMIIASVIMSGVAFKKKKLQMWAVAYYFHTLGNFFQWLKTRFPGVVYDELNIIVSGLGVFLISLTWLFEYLKMKNLNLNRPFVNRKKNIDLALIFPLITVFPGYVLQIIDILSNVLIEAVVILFLSIAMTLIWKIYTIKNQPSYRFFFYTLFVAILDVIATALTDFDIAYSMEITLSLDMLLNIFLLIIPLVLLLEEDIVAKQQENEQLMENLRHAQKIEDIGKLTGGIAHDFNNLLTSLKGNIELAMMEEEGSPQIKNYLKEIGEISTSASFLTKKLLGLSRKSIIEPTSFNPNQEIKSFTKLLSRMLGENINIQMRLSNRNVPIYFDMGNFQQILLNLLVNARDAMPNGGTLTISTEYVNIDDDFLKPTENAPPGQYLKLSVEDTGIGIPKEIQSKIFDPFFTTKGLEKGTGLGLSVVASIIQEAEGLIRLYSELDKGTVFQIYLPLGEKISKSDETEASLVSIPERDSGVVCIVEDDKKILDVVARFLTGKGFTVNTFTSGSDFLDWFFSQGEKIDIRLVLMDIVLPDISGLGVAEQITQQYPDIAFLLTSGYSKYHLAIQEGIEHEFALIQKPFPLKELIKKIYSLPRFHQVK